LGRIKVTWASPVVMTFVLLPPDPNDTVAVAVSGGWFVPASSGGGATHRYATGGPMPSRIGLRATGLRCPDTIAERA
jgi:hypothetical protein